MGFFSKVWKGIKKTVNKIAKPIAKLFAPVNKFFGKFGVLGQIGLMIAMPYAFAAMSSFFAAGGTLSTWAGTLMKSANIGAKALGHGLNMIQKAGAFAGQVYNSISGVLKAGLDRTGNFLMGRGFVPTSKVALLADPAKFTLDAIKPGELGSALESSLAEGINFDPSKVKPFTPTPLVEGTAVTASPLAATTNKLFAGTTFGNDPVGALGELKFTDLEDIMPSFTDAKLDGIDTSSLLGRKDFSKITMPEIDKGGIDFTSTTRMVEAAPQDKDLGVVDFFKEQLKKLDITDPESKIRRKIADFDVVDYASKALETTANQTIFGGIQQVGQQKIAKALGYEQPEGAAYYNINIPEFTSLASQDFGVYNSVDLMQTTNGNAFMGANYTNANSLTNTLDSSSNYNSYMNNFSRGINLGLFG
tara:strand:- start:7285 stop:8538 length:1254 start_codon:yes stop_codon:yes gene_type:complete